MHKALQSGYTLTLGNSSVVGLLFDRWWGGEGEVTGGKMLTTHLHLVAQPRVGGAAPPLSHPSSWHAQGQLISKEDAWMQIIFSEICTFYTIHFIHDCLLHCR